MTSHHFSDHAARVRVSGGPQSIHCFGRDTDGGVEAEGVVGAVEVVVHCLGNTHDGKSCIAQFFRCSEGAFSADGDNGINVVLFQHFGNALGSAVVERVGP